MEIEIKFQVPVRERRALAAWLRAQAADAERLQARYVDTDDRALARAGIALRLRKEGDRWVQTLKTAAHGGALVRTEHNVILPRSRNRPALDIERHRDSDGWPILRRALRKAGAPLLELYGTDMRRLAARIAEGATCIEYAFDTGAISATASGRDHANDRMLSVSELELELMSGPPDGLFDAARALLQQRPLWIDVRSKAMRGEALSGGRRIVAPAHAERLNLASRSTLQQLAHKALADCVRQLSLNLSQIAAAEAYENEHVHQARIALRRLRTAVSLFPQQLRVPAAWKDTARQLGRALGSSRDAAVMAATLWPALRQAGAPLVELPMRSCDATPAEAVRDRQVQLWLLELLAATITPPTKNGEEPWKSVLPTLDTWHAQCRKGARRFAELTDEQRHRLRKRLKRLRYGSEFIADTCPPSKQKVFARKLARALQALGDYNDVHTALVRYRAAAVQAPDALFAAGWLAARLTRLAGRCERALQKFARVDAPWD